MPFQLNSPENLLQFAGQSTIMGVNQAGDLHGECTAAGDNASGGQILQRSTADSHRVNPRVLIEIAVFVCQKGFNKFR